MKRFFCAVLAAFLLLTLTACASAGTKTLDVQAVADALKDGAFTEPLTAVSREELAFSLSALPESCTAAAYRGDGAAEIIAVQCQSAADADAVKAAMDTHIAELKDQASKYEPEQVPILEGAILLTNRSYVVLCITEDIESAYDILQEYLG